MSVDKKIRVLHLSTHNENCGIGKYQEMFLEGMVGSQTVYNEFFSVSPNRIKVLPRSQYLEVFKQLKEQLKDFDILHIQHEFSFYWRDEMRRAVAIANSLNKTVIVTVHTSPNVAHRRPKLTGVGPRSILRYVKSWLGGKRFFYRFITPLKSADLILVHNEVTKAALVQRGIKEEIIRKITIPVPEVSMSKKSDKIKKALHVKDGDIVYGTVGFLHRFKGVDAAIKALNFLPSNYKLAIVGGVHPGTDDPKIYDKLADLINVNQLQDRVHITGYVQDDDELNAYIRECDMCVYPYDREYYSNVSSAALNNAFANGVAVVGYPTASFREINANGEGVVCLTDAFSYYELANAIKHIELKEYRKRSTDFAQSQSYSNAARDLQQIYAEIASRA